LEAIFLENPGAALMR